LEGGPSFWLSAQIELEHLFGGGDYISKAGAELPHSKLEGAAGSGGGGPGPLEIEAAEVAGDVDDFADEEEAWDFAGFHGFAGEVGGVDAAGGDFGFFVAFGAGGADGPGVQFRFERVESDVGPSFWRMELEPAFGQAVGEEFVEGLFRYRCGARAGLANFLGGFAAGSEIDLQCFAFFPIAGGLQDCWAAEAAVGEEHFFAEGGVPRRGDDFGGDAGEVAVAFAIGRVKDEGDQSGAGLHDVQTELAGEIVAEAGGAHFGDGDSTCGDDKRGRAIFDCIGADGEGGVAADFADFGVHDDFYIGIAAFGFEHGDDLRGGVVAEELAEGFFVVGNSVLLDEGDEIGWGVAGKGGLGEVRIFGEEVLRLGVKIREIAAAAAGDQDFLAHFFGAFEEHDAATALAGFDGAHETGCAAAED
jgi:hypothetical protein